MRDEMEVWIPCAGVRLRADLALPPEPRAVVAFAHGSGSGRFSPRNRFVAEELNKRGLATLLLDLLTPAEEDLDAYNARWRFNIALLTDRLLASIDWLARGKQTAGLPIGLFGASTGAAAALKAAARHPGVFAVVSRGGRPDLAAESLALVASPALLIVGGFDTEVLKLNKEALRRLRGDKKLAVVAGATHLFEEPGALEEVARLAGDWFVAHAPAASAA